MPRLVVPELNDPLYGPYEGGGIDDYRAWATGAPSSAAPGDGGESRHAIVERYARGLRIVLARPEQTILVVAHSLPIAYLLGAQGRRCARRADAARHVCDAYELTAAEVERAERSRLGGLAELVSGVAR